MIMTVRNELFIITLFVDIIGTGQSWIWISGNNTIDQPGVYGTAGVPSPQNVPWITSPAELVHPPQWDAMERARPVHLSCIVLASSLLFRDYYIFTIKLNLFNN